MTRNVIGPSIAIVPGEVEKQLKAEFLVEALKSRYVGSVPFRRGNEWGKKDSGLINR